MKIDIGVNYWVFDVYVSGRKLWRVIGFVIFVVFEMLYFKIID